METHVIIFNLKYHENITDILRALQTEHLGTYKLIFKENVHYLNDYRLYMWTVINYNT